LVETSNFLLSKWYMDCVSEEGDVFIAYAASLRWKGLKINYSGTLRRQHDAQTEANTSLKRYSTPKVSGDSIHWSSKALGLEGKWTALAQPIERTIFESDAGRVEWRCLHPRATAEVSTRNQHQLKGLGYVEHLTMSIPPWRLPIDELRWGRFLSNNDALVWIDWRGASNVKLVFLNGVQVESAEVTEREVVLEQEKVILALDEDQVLREGPLIKTALSMIPGIQKLIPLRSLHAYECKWRSRGILSCHENVSAGWTIHEIVRWPNAGARR
jgi:hypothetical protein